MTKELPTLLGVDEVATKLGISESSVLRLASSGQIPSMKIGGKRKFAHHDIWVYLQSLRRKSANEAKERANRLAAKVSIGQLELEGEAVNAGEPSSPFRP